VRCSACATLFMRELPRTEVLHSVYDTYYDDSNLSAPEFVMKRLEEIVATFAPYRTTGRLLDVGFGAGTLLEAARRGGWTAQGVEVSERAVEQARSRGFDVQCASLADARYPDAHFDVVTAVEVLEHVTDPLALLAEIARVLRPGGLLWATTPHARGLSARLLGNAWTVVVPPDHIQLFSLRGIRTLLARAAFHPQRIDTHGINPHEILQHFRRRNPPAGFDRVTSSYELNAFFSERPTRRAIKSAANATLSALRLGDSLKIYATSR
jgi:SAM-dependent methyltransferase